MAASAVHATGLDVATVERLVMYAGGTLGLEVWSGEDWALLGGSQARLSTLARPWGGPPDLAEVAHAVGMALPALAPASWATASRSFPLERPLLVGILNVTPDSFSDGGRFLDPGAALDHGTRLIEAGADLLDLGAESTRPGRPQPVPEDEELARLLPVVDGLRARHPEVALSVDTVKAGVARACLSRGVEVINDVSGGRLDPDLPRVVAEAGAGLVLMHSRGTVSDMASYRHAGYQSLVHDVVAELSEAVGRAVSAGVAEDRIAIDPGLGFAKRPRDSWRLLGQLEALTCLGRPIMVGPSRKRFLAAATGRGVEERDVATAAACALAFERGARLFRVHDVPSTRDALMVALATHEPASLEDPDADG
jgi:dihydropteroate synthase